MHDLLDMKHEAEWIVKDHLNSSILDKVSVIELTKLWAWKKW